LSGPSRQNPNMPPRFCLHISHCSHKVAARSSCSMQRNRMPRVGTYVEAHCHFRKQPHLARKYGQQRLQHCRQEFLMKRGLTWQKLVQLQRNKILGFSESFGNVAPSLCQSRNRYSLSSGMPRASTYREQSYPGFLIPVPGNGLSIPRCLCFLPCM
jgi:hypothetical protein